MNRSFLIDRAINSYIDRSKRLGAFIVDQPNRSMCLDDGKFVTLANNYRVLARFKIINGRLLWVELTERDFARL